MWQAVGGPTPPEYPIQDTIEEAWADITDGDNSPETVTRYKDEGYRVKPVAVLDVSDVDALVEQITQDMLKTSHKHKTAKDLYRAVLESLNIIPKQKKARSDR